MSKRKSYYRVLVSNIDINNLTLIPELPDLPLTYDEARALLIDDETEDFIFDTVDDLGTYGIPLDKGAKLDLNADGEEDNNGKKDYTIKAEFSASGNQLNDAKFEQVMALGGETRNIYFCDDKSKTIRAAIGAVINASSSEEGNEYNKILLTAEQEGDRATIYYRKQFTT